jgi:glycine/D-amino acid oxidase-like deaminating enzyme
MRMSSAVIVGAGVFGAAAADRLAGAGWDVTLVEAVAPGHVRAGSGGESRLIRCAHGEDVAHARSARRAFELWRELGAGLLVECGVAWLARREGGWETESERTLAQLGIPTERVDAGTLFPSIAVDDLAFALHEPEAGVLRARDATRALAERAVARGARLVAGRARPDGARVVVGRETLEADHVVWACGAWLPGLFGDVGLGLRITQQDVFFFAAGAEWATPGVPGWIDYDGATYGVGDLDGRGVKVSPDTEGPPLDPERAERVPTPEHERSARAYLAHRFPALAGAPLVGTRTCQYELTPDTRFLCAPHPEHEGVWLLGGGSGHGFKHGPALAERLERWLTGAEPPDPAYALGARSGNRALRTAGSSGTIEPCA